MGKLFNKKTLTLFSVLVLLVLFVTNAKFSENKKKFITIGTASITGVYYPVGAALCKFINQDREAMIRCNVEATTGSIYNLNSMRNHDIDFGTVQYDWIYNAYKGEGHFSNLGPMNNLRSVFKLHEELLTIVSRKEDNILNIDDIRGTVVNIGAPGTGVKGTMKNLINAKNWDTNKDFKLALDLKSAEEAQALCDKKIDIMTDMIGHPSGSLLEASSTCKINFVKIDKETINKITERYKFYSKAEIPCELYENHDGKSSNYCEKPPTISVKAIFTTTAEQDEMVVYNLVKTIFEKFDQFRSIHSVLANLKKSDLVPDKSLIIPIHPGAERYFKELGIM